VKIKFLIITGFLISFSIGFMVGQIILIKTQKPNEIVTKVVDRSLDKYTIENLSHANVTSVPIVIEKNIKDYPNFRSNLFTYSFDPTLTNGPTKKVSGLINLPHRQAGIPNQTFPLIIMIRGYVSPTDYFTGNGTVNSSLFFAKNGFITVAPDFLGYGESDPEPKNIFEARFQTYTAVMTLLKSINNIPEWNKKDIFIFGHSNGGQIALTTLEITGVNYPTVLWAPVSAPFPFSILYYSDESDDHGKSLRRSLSQFENVYNTDFYSLSNYFDRIKAPIQLDQGTADDAVPLAWSDNLSKTLKGQGLKIDYNIYQGASHNMTPDWNTVIQKDLEYFEKNL
jgi:uncharacterized protein